MPDANQQRIQSTMSVLWLVPLIMVLGNSMLIPILPQIQKALHVNLFKVGLLITVFSIPAGIVIPFAGLISDRIGRKIIMVIAIFIYGLGGLSAGFAAIFFREKAYTFVVISRIIQGIGAGGTYQLAMALVGDLIQSSKRAQALGFLEAANGLGKVVSPIAGASIGLISWYAPFFVYGLLAIPIAILIWIFAKDAANKKQPPPFKQYFQGLLQVVKQKGGGLFSAFFGGTTVLFVLFGLLSLLSDYLSKKCHIDLFPSGLLIAIPVLFMSITSYILGTVLQKKLTILLKWNIIFGLGLVICGLILYAFVNGPAWPIVAVSLVGIGTGSVLPSINTLITSATATAERGLVTSLYGSVRFFGVAIGPPAFSLSEKAGLAAILLPSAGLALIAIVLSLLLINAQKMLPKELKSS